MLESCNLCQDYEFVMTCSESIEEDRTSQEVIMLLDAI